MIQKPLEVITLHNFYVQVTEYRFNDNKDFNCFSELKQDQNIKNYIYSKFWNNSDLKEVSLLKSLMIIYAVTSLCLIKHTVWKYA